MSGTLIAGLSLRQCCLVVEMHPGANGSLAGMNAVQAGLHQFDTGDGTASDRLRRLSRREFMWLGHGVFLTLHTWSYRMVSCRQANRPRTDRDRCAFSVYYVAYLLQPRIKCLNGHGG